MQRAISCTMELSDPNSRKNGHSKLKSLMENCTTKRWVGTRQQPLDDASNPSRSHWGTSNRQSAEQGRVDADCHGPDGRTRRRESRGTLTLEGQQWSMDGSQIHTGELDAYLGDYMAPSPSQMDEVTEYDYENEADSEDENSQTEADRLGEEEHGIILELPTDKHQCPKCSVVFNKTRILKDHLAATHGLRDIVYRCRLCKTTFDRVHRLECHAPRCKAGGEERTPSDAAFPFGCVACTLRFLSKSGRSQHERFKHPDIANLRRINASKLEAERKREKRNVAKQQKKREAEKERAEKLAAKAMEKREADRKRKTIHEAEEPQKRNLRSKGKPVVETEAPVLQTEWDETAIEIFRNIHRQMGDIKGLHAAVRVKPVPNKPYGFCGR